MTTTEILQNLRVRAAGVGGVAFQYGVLCLGSGATKDFALKQSEVE